MKKAILLCRVSTPKQSLDEMERQLYAMAVADGYQDDEQHIIAISKKESGIKLSEEEREGLNEMKHQIETDKEIDCVYAWEISRIARKKKVLFSILDYLTTRGIQLIIREPEIRLLNNDRTINEAAETVFTLFSQMAESEMRNKKVRFARGKREGAAQNKYTGGQVPFGYKVDENTKRIIIDEQNAEIIKQVFNEYANGMSTTQIAKLHQSLGQKKLTISYVHQLLTNRMLTGEPTEEHEVVQKVKGEERKWIAYSRTYPQIISKQLFDKCREIAKKNNTNIDKSKNIYYASRLIRCTNCGCFFIGAPSKVNYMCIDKANVNKKYNGYDESSRCTNGITISINVMDSLLWHIGAKLEAQYIVNAAEADVKKYKDQINTIQIKIENIKPRLDALEEKTKKIRKVYIDGESDEWYEREKSKIAKDRSAILEEQKQYQEQIEHLTSLIEGISSKFSNEGASVIASLITKTASIYNNVRTIEDDKSRSEIIHKHIKNITITYTKVPYTFNKYKEVVEAEGKLITIECYNGDVLRYVYIPYGGRGRGYVKVNDDGTFEQIEIPYLSRFVDEGKRERHKQESAKNKEVRENKKQQRQQEYLTVSEVAELIGKHPHKVAYDIKAGHLKAEQQANRQFFIKVSDFNEYSKWVESRNNSMYRGKRINETPL